MSPAELASENSMPRELKAYALNARRAANVGLWLFALALQPTSVTFTWRTSEGEEAFEAIHLSPTWLLSLLSFLRPAAASSGGSNVPHRHAFGSAQHDAKAAMR
ncbi:hypothetical protein HPB50_012653 [Hyalomma asiaticum]|uniref:Uncharacterized protein n=1 Tax=Hyalomma asiaticum TaxID=266040 RepID=A0ACB7SV87_HYAAI|nr:hypothetical protein HPB50_012653 [Hyalomma asiaticum]